MADDRVERIHRILLCTESLVHSFNPGRDHAWLSCDLTMPQLKTLAFVTRNDGATSGQIAARLGVTLSTITGIVDRLAEQHLVTRSEDPRDRRITRVLPTTSGRQMVDELFQYRNEIISSILAQLDAHQLETVENAFHYLIDAVNRLSSSNQEVVA